MAGNSGVQGPVGSTGPQGPQGSQGNKGEQGNSIPCLNVTKLSASTTCHLSLPHMDVTELRVSVRIKYSSHVTVTKMWDSVTTWCHVCCRYHGHQGRIRCHRYTWC